MWNSIDLLSSLSISIQVFITILGAVLIIITVRKAGLEKQEAFEKDRVIAESRREAATATERAELAILGQRELNLKAEQLRSKNLDLEQAVGDMKLITALSEEALAGSRDAYERLVDVSSSGSASSKRAKERVTYINRQLAFYEQPPGIVISLDLSATVGGKLVRISELPTGKLFEYLEDESMSETNRFSIINDIFGKLISEINLYALRMLKEGQYLPAVAATCSLLRRVHGKRIGFMDIGGWRQYLEAEAR